MQLQGLVITATISSLHPGHYGDDPSDTVRLPQRGLSSQSLGK